MAANKLTGASRKLLRTLAKQSKEAYRRKNLHKHEELSMLCYLLRTASPRARSVVFENVSFPIVHTLVYRAAVCPDSGMKLVGVFDL
ncbi:MAG TPA: hypothetical protein PLU47_08045 [Azonexus sp.]|nr:hypothetical protein [Azonexus sp.]